MPFKTLIVILLLISPLSKADVIFKTLSEVEIYQQQKQAKVPTGRWPMDIIFTAKPQSDTWLQITGAFQSNAWTEFTQPLYIKQRDHIALIHNIADELDLIERKVAEWSMQNPELAGDIYNLKDWQQKQDLKDWINKIGKEQYLPKPLLEETGKQVKTKLDRLTDLAANNSLKLNGNKSSLEFSFGTRLDRAVESAHLDLEYMYSPSLVDSQSQVKVYLNDEVVEVLRVPSSKAGKIVRKKITLPNHQFKEFNRIKFELFGYYETIGGQCFDPKHLSLWFELLSSSKLTLNELTLPLKNDLSLLPAPFFDSREMIKQQAHFVFPTNISDNFVEAAGMLSGWLGVQSDWRGTQFEVSQNELPEGHAIVLATNDAKPYFLKDYPKVSEPTILMVSHPFHSEYKLLLLIGANEQQLKTAAESIAIAHENLAGQAATVSPIQYQSALKPYQAPFWVNSERPMKLSELVKDESELRREGVYLSPIQVNLHIPADLFIWETKGVPVDLKYRYTPPNDPSQSMLNVKVNGTLVESFKLNEGDGIWDGGNRIRMPFSDESFTMTSELLLPSFQLGIQNVMEFDFIIRDSSKACINQPSNKFVQVDYNSTLDFSDFEHYAEMPNLASLAYSGLPYTRLADLSETLIVMPEQFSIAELKMVMTILARFSAVTGYPTTKMDVIVGAEAFNKVDKNKDIIFINSDNKFDPNLSGATSALVSANLHSLSLTRDLFNDSHLSQRNFIGSAQDAPYVTLKNQFKGDMAIISQFQSPYYDGRTVMSIMAAQHNAFDLVSNLFEDATSAYQVKGSVLLLHKNKIRYSTVGEKYYTGDLPIWIMTRYHLSQRPILLLSVVFIMVMIVTFIAWRFLKYMSYRRIHNDQ